MDVVNTVGLELGVSYNQFSAILAGDRSNETLSSEWFVLVLLNNLLMFA